jgi:dipeptidyl aminopeptidase/acylaminoacyl peptidase
MLRLIARWTLLVLALAAALHGAALAAGISRPNAVLAYVEQYGESAQMRMLDAERRLDRHIRNHPDCHLDWIDRERLIFSEVLPGQRQRVTVVSPWRPAEAVPLADGRQYEEAPTAFGGQIAYAENWSRSNHVILLDAGERRIIPDLAIWISDLQWSADGRRILAQGMSDNMNAGTYLLDVEQGTARTLPSYRRAMLTPDGASVVFDFQGDLYALDVETEAGHVLLNDGRVNWQPVPSPDGRLIAYISEGVRLRLLDLATGETRTLVERAYAEIGLMAWSPDGARIAFASRPVVDNVYALLTPYNIEIADVRTGAVTQAKRGAGSYVNNFSRFCAFAWLPAAPNRSPALPAP